MLARVWVAAFASGGLLATLTVYDIWYIIKDMNGKQVIKKLEVAGWVVIRTRGSHYIMAKEGVARSVPVPCHGAVDLKKPLVKALEKQTGVKLL
jgi:predicted RNA binding protein YcfA (HicA-like mRNA interferase family)